VIATIAMIAVMQSSTRRVCIVIPNDNLRLRDSKFFSALWRTSGKQSVGYYKNLGFIPDDEDFVIIDESD
jgi:hypothetical protein